MSYKSVLSNSLKSNRDTPQWIPKTESNVKLAGEEAKDRLYEPKHKKKLVRVLTVVAYIFSVSLAAIMLSLYYVFVYPSQIPKKQDETTTRHPGFGDHFNASNHGNVSDVATPQALSSIKGDLPTLLEKLIAHYDTN